MWNWAELNKSSYLIYDLITIEHALILRSQTYDLPVAIRRCDAMMTRGEVGNIPNAPVKESNLWPTDRWFGCPSRWWLGRNLETLLLPRAVHMLFQFSQKLDKLLKSCRTTYVQPCYCPKQGVDSEHTTYRLIVLACFTMMVTPLNAVKVWELRTRSRIYDLLITNSGVFCDGDSKKLGKSPNVRNKELHLWWWRWRRL